jgi:cytochrome c oxidase assembly factor CtaG
MVLTWPFDPTVYAGLVGLLFGYAWLARERLDQDERRPLYFLSGVVVLWVALETPIDTIGEQYLGSIHMVQHMLLGIVAPPLLLLGLSPQMAELLVRRIPGLGWATRPVQAQVITATMWIGWHVPWLYELSIASLQVHVLEHLLFIGSGLLLFWPLLDATSNTLAQPLNGGWRMLYIAIATIPQDGVAIPLQFSNFVFYAPYRTIPAIAPGYTAVVDQTVSGAIMMLIANAVLGAMLVLVFFRWMHREEERQKREDAESESEEEEYWKSSERWRPANRTR